MGAVEGVEAVGAEAEVALAEVAGVMEAAELDLRLQAVAEVMKVAEAAVI
jgi:hypothetical protein